MKTGWLGKMMFVAAVLAAAISASAGGGCRKKKEAPPVVAAALPLQRIVLYRNGVGYFERAGEVKGDTINFKVRESQVGDFLASLTVVTPAGKPVEFVTFPIKKEEDEDGDGEKPPCYPGYPYPYPPGPPPWACPGNVPPDGGDHDDDDDKEDEDTIDVVVRLKEGTAAGEVIVSYIVESPIWRPTYRIVLKEGGEKALLQGWAVVQNTSGEDWEDVRLTVTEGTPLTFRADLANPFIPLRPLVTDQGEVVQGAVSSSVSVSEETRSRMDLARAEDEGKLEEATAMAALDGIGGVEPDVIRSMGFALPGAVGGGVASGPGLGPGIRSTAAAEELMARAMHVPADFGVGGARAGGTFGGMALGASEARGTSATAPAPPPPPPPPPPPGLSASGAEASLALLALGAQEGGITTYRGIAPVTVRNDASTLVAIFNQVVEASDTLLYRPDPAVPASSTNPFRVVRFTNEAGVTLERGPVAIFATETFLGQGLLQPLPMGATTSIPYALERGISIAVEHDTDTDEARLVKINRGVLTVQRYQMRKTKYVLQNVTDRDGKVFIQHTRTSGYEIKSLPEGSEEVDTRTVIVPLEFKAHEKAEITIIERTPTKQDVQLITDVGHTALRLYLEGPAVDEAAGPALRRALEIRDRIAAIDLDIKRFSEERDEVSNAMYQVQNNLYAIDGIRRAAELRRRLINRLTELQRNYDELQTKVIDLTDERGQLVVEMSEALQGVTLDVPDEPPAARAAPAEPSPQAPDDRSS